MDVSTETLTLDEARALLERAAMGAGAGERAARSIARAAVAAEAEGLADVGIAHFLDYLTSLRAGRIDGSAEPRIIEATPVIFRSDAGGGVAHLGFDKVFERMISAAEAFGVAVFSQRAAYTCGQLGYFADRLARRGLVALAATNGPPLLAGSGTTRPVFCTNPVAFAAPRAGGRTLLIDQSSSQAAHVSIRRAAEAGERLPEGWALDAEGRPTTDPAAAMKGALLAFGGGRGANVAMMVEVLAAGLTGANWSIDAPSFSDGSESPRTGLFVLALDPVICGGGTFPSTLEAWLERLREEHGAYIPGERRQVAIDRATRQGLAIPCSLLDRLWGHAAEG